MKGIQMKPGLILLGLFLSCSCLLAAEGNQWTVDTDFPGGNMIEDSRTDDSFAFHADRRDSDINECTDRHWAIRVRNAQGRTIRFTINGDSKFGYLQNRGPAVSRDCGRTWTWLLPEDLPPNPPNTFVYTFRPDEKDLRFAVVPMYTGMSIDLLLSDLAGKPIRKEILCRSEKGRDVELLRFGNPKNPKKVGIVLTSRTHANETWGVWTLDGIVREVLSGSPEGNYLLENADFFVVPLMDKDGVEEGDQGKTRKPHDHNRDFDKDRYATVRALKKQVIDWGQGKKLIGFDFHGNSVGLRATLVKGAEWAVHPHFFIADPLTGDELKRFSELFMKRQKMGFAEHSNTWDQIREFPAGLTFEWMTREKKVHFILAATSESPSHDPKGVPQTIDTAHELGGNFAKSLADYIKNDL